MPERKIRQIEKLIAELQEEVAAQRTPLDPDSPRLKRWWRGFVVLSRKSVILTVRSAAGATLIAVAGYISVVHKTDVAADNRVNDNIRATATAVYQNSLSIYTTSVLSRDSCVSGVGASLRNRAMWEITVGLLRSSGLDDAADTLSKGPLLEAPPRTEADCPRLAPLPVDPATHMQPPLDPVTSLPLPPVGEETPTTDNEEGP